MFVFSQVHSLSPPHWSNSRRDLVLEVDHEQTLDLRQDLFITETRSTDCPGRASRNTGSATLAQSRVDFSYHAIFMEEDGVEWTKVIANPAAGTFLLVHACPIRFKSNFTLLDPTQYSRRGCSTLRYALWNIFRTLNTTGYENTFRHGCDRVEL